MKNFDVRAYVCENSFRTRRCVAIKSGRNVRENTKILDYAIGNNLIFLTRYKQQGFFSDGEDYILFENNSFPENNVASKFGSCSAVEEEDEEIEEEEEEIEDDDEEDKNIDDDVESNDAEEDDNEEEEEEDEEEEEEDEEEDDDDFYKERTKELNVISKKIDKLYEKLEEVQKIKQESIAEKPMKLELYEVQAKEEKKSQPEVKKEKVHYVAGEDEEE